MSKKTKTTNATTKKENLAALGLPALWERYKDATGETTKSPNKKFLVRRIQEALAARAVEPAFVEESTRSAHPTSAPESRRRRSLRARRRSRADGLRR